MDLPVTYTLIWYGYTYYLRFNTDVTLQAPLCVPMKCAAISKHQPYVQLGKTKRIIE